MYLHHFLNRCLAKEMAMYSWVRKFFKDSEQFVEVWIPQNYFKYFFFFLCLIVFTSINEKRASTWEIKSQYFKEIKNNKNYFKRKNNILISQEGHVTVILEESVFFILWSINPIFLRFTDLKYFMTISTRIHLFLSVLKNKVENYVCL